MLSEIILFMIGGALAGLLAGLLGIGGGLVVVPFLNYVLPHLRFPDEAVMHVAVATSLMIVVGTSISSIAAHHRRGGVLWSLVLRLLPGIIIGSIIAAQIAQFLSSNLLKIIFGVFVLFLAYRIAFKFRLAPEGEAKLPHGAKLFSASALISGVCNLLGMGGGSLLVPYFAHYNVSIRHAVATSAVCSFPIALTGVVGLLFASPPEVGLPQWTLGYIYWPAFILMVIPSIIMAPLGARLAHILPADKLKKVFAVFLIVVGVDMLKLSFDQLLALFG